MTDLDSIEIFRNNKTELKETSKDNHDGSDIYMTQSSLSVVNFDAVKDEYIRDLGVPEAPASNDALYLSDDGEYYFIEFKNGYIDTNKRFEIRLKIFDSLLLFTDIAGKSVSFTRKNMNYILVYNEGRNVPEEINGGVQVSLSREKISRYFIENRARKKYIRFNLERFEKLYFKGVYTYNQEYFETEFVSKYSS
ncbi:MAG: hypothetical protein FWH55_11100 [Oscillospiraceae bacterium]|nr:hypothetical protein [Oscillospiraceae bacterium]